MSNSKAERSRGNTFGQWPQLMQVWKSIEVTNSPQMLIRQEWKLYSRAQTPNSTDSGNSGNKTWKWFGSMKECRSIEVLHSY
jgi:hypothetical protein